MSLNATTIYWYLAHYAKKLGLWGWLGLLLLAGSWIFYQSNVPTMQDATAALVASKVSAQTAQETSEHVEIIAHEQQTTQDDVSRFYARFPQVHQLQEALSDINQLAVKQRVALNSGEYKLDKIKQAAKVTSKNSASKVLTKYQITFPVTGHYKNIRTFVAKVLAQSPGVALTDMQIKRDTTIDEMVEARLVFVLFVKGEAWQN